MLPPLARTAQGALLGALLLAIGVTGCSPSASDGEQAPTDSAPVPAAPASPAPTEPGEETAGLAEADEPGHQPDSAQGASPEDQSVGDARATDPADAPLRGAWVHLFDRTLKTRAGIAALVDDLVAADATAVVAQVARRHDAYYRSDVLPATPDPELEPGLDVLGELLRTAHARGLEVHAWVSVAPTWHEVYDDLDPPEGWLSARHGVDAPESQRWVTRTADGQWADYLDPALPQVRDHVAAVVTELAERYPVDGVHLDYVRYASERHGYHPDALDRFRAETGATGSPAPDDADWSAWRRAQTREVIASARAALDATGQDVTLSAAVITWGAGPGPGQAAGFENTRTHREALQDWPDWVREGLVDVVMPMNYFRAHVGEQAAWLDQWTRFQDGLAETSEARIVPGVAGWLNSPDAVVEQVHRATRQADGALVYSYQQPTVDGSRGVWGRLAESRWGVAESPAD